MSWTEEYVELDKKIHDRAFFDSGEVELNRFLQTQAAKHMEAGISRTLILPASTPLSNGKYPICAFYTIAPSSIKRASLPENFLKKLPHYPVPVFLLAQMAVHLDFHHQGLGKITLIKALENLWEINFHMRGFAVVVDCLNKNAEQFYLKYGFQFLNRTAGRSRMFIPMKVVAQLFIK